jgi:activator of HSP90 ATPase
MSYKIHQEVIINASPQQVYSILIETEEFSKINGGVPTEISPDAGGTFSCFGGMIVGRNIELVTNKRIVQAWRVKTWEPGVFSIAKFQLNNEDGKTKIEFDHVGFPESEYEHLNSGWYSNYWDPIKKFLG